MKVFRMITVSPSSVSQKWPNCSRKEGDQCPDYLCYFDHCLVVVSCAINILQEILPLVFTVVVALSSSTMNCDGGEWVQTMSGVLGSGER